MFQPLATYLRRQNELINLAITQVVEFPPAVGIGALADHSVPCSILATQVDSPPLRDFFGNAVPRISSIYCLSWRRRFDQKVGTGVSPKRDVRPNEVASPDRPYLLSPPEDESRDRSRTVDDRR